VTPPQDNFNFQATYRDAKKQLRSYGDEDSLLGLITFMQNRVSWAGKTAEEQVEENARRFDSDTLKQFYSAFEKEIGKNELQAEWRAEFEALAEKYEQKRGDLFLDSFENNDFSNAMDLA